MFSVNAVDSDDWLFLVNILSGAVEIAGGVLFLFCLLGDGAVSSDKTHDCSSLSWSSLSDGTGCCMMMSLFEVPAGISVCNLIALVCSFCVGRPPVRFPVALAFRFVGLSVFACPDTFYFWVSFLGRPVSSCLNFGGWGAVGFSMSKNRRHGPDLRADL